MAFLLNGKLVKDDALYQAKKNEPPNEIANLEKNRFHLYVSNTCPFSQRVLLVINLLGLQEYISTSLVSPLKGEFSWEFSTRYVDPINDYQYLYQTYQHAKVEYSGRITVPVLWDKKQNTIGSTDSFAIAIWLSEQGKEIGDIDLVPEVKIKTQCTWVNENINKLFIQTGLAKSTEISKNKTLTFFDNLEVLNQKLKDSRYFYNGENITLTDIMIMPTLFQLEKITWSLFEKKLNVLNDYKYLFNYFTDLIDQEVIQKPFLTG